MGLLDPNIHSYRKCVDFKESTYLLNKSNESLAKDLTGNLTENSTSTLNNSSFKGSAENFNENALHASSSITVNSKTRNLTGMDVVSYPAGEFEMGSPSREKRRKLWESPVHRVTIKKPFYLGIYPVTQEQWNKVMGESLLFQG